MWTTSWNEQIVKPIDRGIMPDFITVSGQKEHREPPIRGGYILLSRKIIIDQIFAKPPLYLKVWIYLLARAQYSYHKGLQRGQVHTSISEIRQAVGHMVGFRRQVPTIKEIRDVLDWLRRSDEGHSKGTMTVSMKVTHGQVITICNYDYYQTPANYEGQSEGHHENLTKEEAGAQYIQEGNKNDKKVPGENGVSSNNTERGPEHISEVLSRFQVPFRKDSSNFSPLIPTLPQSNRFLSAEQIEGVLRDFCRECEREFGISVRWPGSTTKHCLAMQAAGVRQEELTKALSLLRKKYAKTCGQRMTGRVFSPGYDLLDKIIFLRKGYRRFAERVAV